MSETKAIALRFGIMAVVVMVATVAFEVLGSVESIVGAVCSMSSSMLLPAFIYLRYMQKRSEQNRSDQIRDQRSEKSKSASHVPV